MGPPARRSDTGGPAGRPLRTRTWPRNRPWGDHGRQQRKVRPVHKFRAYGRTAVRATLPTRICLWSTVLLRQKSAGARKFNRQARRQTPGEKVRAVKQTDNNTNGQMYHSTVPGKPNRTQCQRPFTMYIVKRHSFLHIHSVLFISNRFILYIVIHTA